MSGHDPSAKLEKSISQPTPIVSLLVVRVIDGYIFPSIELVFLSPPFPIGSGVPLDTGLPSVMSIVVVGELTHLLVARSMISSSTLQSHAQRALDKRLGSVPVTTRLVALSIAVHSYL